MRNIFNIRNGLFLLASGLLSVSCSDSIADQIAGKWQVDSDVFIYGTFSFQKDAIGKGGGSLINSIVIKDTTACFCGRVKTATVTINMKGKWYIDDNAKEVPCYLHFSFNPNTIKVNVSDMTYHDRDGKAYTFKEAVTRFGEEAASWKEERLEVWTNEARKSIEIDNDKDKFSGYKIFSLDQNILKAEFLSNTDKKDSQEAENDTIVFRRISE